MVLEMGWVLSLSFLRTQMWSVLHLQLWTFYSELLNGFSCKHTSVYWRITNVISIFSSCVICDFQDVVLALSVSWLDECSSSKALRNIIRAINIFLKLIEEGWLSKGSLHILFWVLGWTLLEALIQGENILYNIRCGEI